LDTKESEKQRGGREIRYEPFSIQKKIFWTHYLLASTHNVDEFISLDRDLCFWNWNLMEGGKTKLITGGYLGLYMCVYS